MPKSTTDKIKEHVESPGSETAQKLFEFFRLMAVCHTVVIEKREGKDPQFLASSPDELALIQGSK